MITALVLATATPRPTEKDEKAQPVRPHATAPSPDRDEQSAEPEPRRQAQKRTEEQEEEERAAPTTEIVVTARRLDVARTGIDVGLGATVYELHNETIENRPGGETGSIAAILTQSPGVTLSSSVISVRGSSALQVRINGAIIPEAISDPADRLSSRLAESTRLITGTLPAQFGFAPGGVIAVTTKNGLYQHGGQAELFLGSRGAFEPAFEWGGSADSSSLFASGSLEWGRARVAGLTGASATDARHEIGGLGFADHVIDDENRLSLIFGGSRESQRIGETDLPSGIEQTANAYAVGTFQHSAKDFSLEASLFAGRATETADFTLNERERRSSVGTQIDSSLEAGAGNTVRAGLLLTRSTSQEAGTVLTEKQQRRTSLGLYLQDEWKLDSRLTVNAGLRGDWLRSLGSAAALEPRASLVWQSPGGFTAHAGYARYASAPPLGEEQASTRLPNERDDYVDAGVQQKIGPVTIGIDGYWRSAHNLIVEHKTRGTAIPAAFAFSRGRFRGVELSATYARGPVSAWANLTISKSQARTIIGGESLFSPETLAAANGRWTDLASDRPVTASGGVSWRIGKLNLSADVLAGSGAVRTLSPSDPNGARAPAFASFGLAAVYHLKVLYGPLDLRADLINLTDVRYIANDAANLEGGWTRFTEGRSVLVGLEKAF